MTKFNDATMSKGSKVSKYVRKWPARSKIHRQGYKYLQYVDRSTLFWKNIRFLMQKWTRHCKTMATHTHTHACTHARASALASFLFLYLALLELFDVKHLAPPAPIQELVCSSLSGRTSVSFSSRLITNVKLHATFSRVVLFIRF